MPKFKSVVVREEEQLGNGKVREGITAWIPLDDAAKAHKATQKAVELGQYKPIDPNERENVAKKLKAAEIEDLKRRGRMPR